MRQIAVNNRTDIKQLLCSDYIVGVRNSSSYPFGGFELWWYDRQRDVCQCRRSLWHEFRRQTEEHSLDHAIGLLWQNRGNLFLRRRRTGQEGDIAVAAEACN